MCLWVVLDLPVPVFISDIKLMDREIVLLTLGGPNDQGRQRLQDNETSSANVAIVLFGSRVVEAPSEFCQ